MSPPTTYEFSHSLPNHRRQVIIENRKKPPKSGPSWGLQRVMRSHLPHPLKQEENSIQVTLHLLVSLHPNLKKTEESSLRVIMDRAPSLLQSSLPPPRQEESFLQRNETDEGPISVADKPQLHEKEEGSVYPSVGKKRPPCSLGKGN